MSSPKFTSSPPAIPNTIVSFRSPHVLLITLNRPAQLNAIPADHHAAYDALYRWYDAEPSLRCAVITGTGRAFCAGADLKEWHDRSSAARGGPRSFASTAGFGGLSNRAGKKPVIAAVNGLCLGGGMEMAINCDMVVAAADARFALPEVTRGVIALAGALPRLVRTVGRQRAAEMALTGRMFSAEEMERWGLVNRVVAAGPGKEGGVSAVLEEALRLAETVAGNSPDGIIVSREGLRLGWEGIGPELGTELVERGLYGRIDNGENMQEGLKSFVERREAVWKDSKL